MIRSAVCLGTDAMKKGLLIVFCALFLIFSVTSCTTPALNKSGEEYVHEKTGVAYRFASANYVAEPSGDEIARLIRPVSGEASLYAVNGRTDERFLVTDAGRVLFDASMPLPILSELPVREARLYDFSLNMAMTAMEDDADALEEIRLLCTAEVCFDADEISPALTRSAYELRLIAADALEGVYYCLQYWKYDGDVLIYAEYTDDEAASLLYPGIPYTLVVEEKITYVCYNFGDALFYDPVTDQCRAAEDAFSSDASE